MKKYSITVYGGLVTIEQNYTSNSRNCRKHLIDTGADHCKVFYNGTQVSEAVKDCDNNIYYINFE